MRPVWFFATDFGDTGVTVPLAFAVFAVLFMRRERRTALAWAAAVAGCAALIAALKLLLATCARCFFAIPGLASPSGHTAMSAAVYVSLAWLIGRPLPQPWCWAATGVAAVFVSAIAYSRFALRLHSAPEVLVGFGVGITAVAIFREMLGGRVEERLPAALLAGAAVVLIAMLHGTRWPAEQAIRASAGLLQRLLPWCG